MAEVRPVGKAGVKEVERRYPISWSGLSHAVSLRGGKSKTIVSNVFGHCEPGQMMAIMGPSGCGKTSLLDLLGGRVGSGVTTGEILIGCKQHPANIRKIVSYVTQEDSLLTCFTVRETLRYASRLAVASLPAKTREEEIQEVMVQMGLLACAETRVGDPLIKGISGGQKRRLSIAIELLQRSPILLLDEPTSGLDSTAAMQVIEHLRDVAQKGHTVVMSIHQASSRAYGLFDSLCLLSKGQQVYFGPAADVAIQHFAAQGHACPQYSNPAEFFLDVINTDFEAEDDAPKLEGLVRAFDMSELAGSMRKAVIQHEAPQDGSDPTNSAGLVRQFAVLLLRMLHMNWKNPYIFGVRLAMYIALAFMVGTMYYDVGEVARGDEPLDGEAAATSLLALLFYVQAFLVFMSVAILPFFLEIRDVFRRERANGQITCLPYVLADFLAGLPGVTLIALISTMLVVWLANLNGFGQFFANLLLSLIVAESLMHVIGAAQPHYIIGMAFGAGLFGMFMLCEGFMVKPQDIPTGWVWGYYLAFHTYSFEWFVHNQFDDGTRVGEVVLKSFDMENVDPVRNALILSAYAAVFQAAYFIVLKVFHTGKR